MAKPEAEAPLSPSSDDRRQWQRIFAALVEMVQSQQSQIKALTGDCKFLEDYIYLQRSNSASRAILLKSHISQMKKEEEMVRRLHAAKLNLMISAKEREALVYKKQLEFAESELEDFHDCVETLGKEMSELKDKSKCSEADKGKAGADDLKTLTELKEKEQRIAAVEREMRKSKHELRKLISQKDADISALLAEKDFVWNQFKRMDNDYTNLVQTKHMEVERANETIQILQHSLEVLQSSADEKDKTIANLEAERTRLELDVRRLTQETEHLNKSTEKLQLYVEELQLLDKEKDATIANLKSELAKFETSLTKCTREKTRFSKDLDPQRKSSNDWVTPAGSHSRKRSGKPSLQTAEGPSSQKCRLVHENSSGSQAASPVIGLHRCMKVLQAKPSPPSLETPRLFSSKLKVPKLKNPSPALV